MAGYRDRAFAYGTRNSDGSVTGYRDRAFADEKDKSQPTERPVLSFTYKGQDYSYTQKQLDDLRTSYKSLYSKDPSFAAKASTSYTDSDFDKQMRAYGLPSWSSWSTVQKYANSYMSSGSMNDVYGSLSDATWSKINDLWKKDWQYGLSTDDLMRKQYGYAPASYDSMYEDTLLDDQLKAAHLPPSKLLNGELGTKYLSWLDDNDKYNEIMTEVAKDYAKNKGQKNVTTVGGVTVPTVDFTGVEEYTMQNAYDSVLARPEYAEFGLKHSGSMQNVPNLEDYAVMEYGVQKTDENGNPVYDYTKYNNAYEKAMKNNVALQNDEFALTVDKAQQYYDKNYSTIKAYEDALEAYSKAGVNPLTATEKDIEKVNDVYAGQQVNLTVDDLFGTVAGGGDMPKDPTTKYLELSDDQRKRYQVFVDKFNQIAHEQGYKAAAEYWNGGQLQRDITNSDIVASYRQEYADVPSYANKTDDEIIDEHYSKIANSYGMDETQKQSLRDGTMSISDYMTSKVKTDADAWEFARERMKRELSSRGLPTTKEELEKAESIPTWLYKANEFSQAFGNKIMNKLSFGLYNKVNDKVSPDAILEKLSPELSSVLDNEDALHRSADAYDNLVKQYYIDAVSYTQDFRSLTADEDRINEKFNRLVRTAYSIEHESGVTELDKKRIDLVTQNATDDEKRRAVYLAEKNGWSEVVTGKDGASRQIEHAEFATDYIKSIGTSLSNAEIYDRKNLVADMYENSSALGKFAMSVGAENLNILANPIESAYNFVKQTYDTFTGRDIYASDMASWSSDIFGAVAGEIEKNAGSVVGTAYQMAPSFIQSSASAAAAYFTGGATEAFTLAAMGMESYSSTAQEALLNGATTDQAWALGLAAGAAEILFEKVSLDKFVKDIDAVGNAWEAALKSGGAVDKSMYAKLGWDITKHIGTQSSVEGSEEGATSITNFVVEQLVLGFDSSYERTKQHYLDAGLSETDARRMAGAEVTDAVKRDVILGMVSGALMTFGSDIISVGRHGVPRIDPTGIKRFTSSVHNLSAIDTDQALEIAKEAAKTGVDADGNLTVAGAQNVVKALLDKGADAAVLASVRNEYVDTTDIEDPVANVFETAIIKTRNDNLATLVKAAERVSARTGITKGMNAETADRYRIMVSDKANEYLNNLSATLQTQDRQTLTEDVANAQEGYINEVMRSSGAARLAGIRSVYDYMRTVPAESIEQGAVPFMAALKQAGMENMDDAATYANLASALVGMTSDADFVRAFSDVFGTSVSDVSTTIRNACLNSCSDGSIGFVDVALNSIGLYETTNDDHLVKVLGGNMDSGAYVTGLLATSQLKKAGTSSKAIYDNIAKYGVTSSKLDVLAASAYRDNMKKSSRESADAYVRSKQNDAFMTTSELKDVTEEYNAAKQNVASKEALIASHEAHNKQTLDVANNIVERHLAAYTSLQESETFTDADGNKRQTVSADLAEQAASTAAALSDAINARDNLAQANADRLTSAQADLDAAREKFRKVSRKYKTAMNRHACAYVQLVSPQLESINGGHVPSNAEFDRLSARAINGTREDINSIDTRIIASEKRQAIAFGNEIGVEVHVEKFTSELLAEHGDANGDYLNAKGFEHKGVVYMNDTFFEKEGRVGYGVDYVIGHEFAHVAEKATKYFKRYAQFAEDYLREQVGINVDITKKNKGVEEVVAEFSRLVLFKDPNAVKALASKAPVMAMRLYTWLNTLSAKHNNSLAQMKGIREAQINFAKALKNAKPGINNVSAESVTRTNDAMSERNALEQVKESERVSDEKEDFTPEAPPEDTAVAYGEELDMKETEQPVQEEEYYSDDGDRAFSYTDNDARSYSESDFFDNISEDDDFAEYSDEGDRAFAYTDNEARSYDPSDFFGDDYEAEETPSGFYDITQSFEDQLNDENFPEKDVYLVGRTPDLYRKLGIPVLPMTITQPHVAENRESTRTEKGDDGHVLNDEDLYRIMDYIADPVAVYIDKQHDNRITIVTDMKSKLTNDWVIVGLAPGYTPKVNDNYTDVNMLASIHGKRSIGTILENYIKREVAGKSNELLYINKQKASNLLGLRQTAELPKLLGSLPTTSPVLHTLASNGVVVKRNSPKAPTIHERNIGGQLSTQQFKRWFGDSKAVDDGKPMKFSVSQIDKESATMWLRKAESKTGKRYFASVQNPYEMKLDANQAQSVYEKYGASNSTDSETRASEIAKLQDEKASYETIKKYAKDNGITVAQLLKEQGYDGIHDGDSWGVFNARQAKLADYQNTGTFDRRSSNPRYFMDITSLRNGNYDAEYMELAQKYVNDETTPEEEERLAELVENAAVAAGVISDEFGAENWFHGSTSYGFSEFISRDGGAFFLSNNPYVARGYSNSDAVTPREMWRKPVFRWNENLYSDEDLIQNAKAIAGKTLEKDGKYFVDQETGEVHTKHALFEELRNNFNRGIYGLYAFAGDNQYRIDANDADWSDLEDEHGSSTDEIERDLRGEASTVRIDNVVDPGYFKRPMYDSVADDLIVSPGDSRYIKSADLVTMDDDRNIIPLSQRFNKEIDDIRYFTEISKALDGMSEQELARYGNPRMLTSPNGLVVSRDVSAAGFMYGNPTVEGTRNIAMLYTADKFSDGTNAFMHKVIGVRDCLAVVVPKGVEYADVFNTAKENGVNVVTYDDSDAAQYDNAIKIAAMGDDSIHYFVEGIDELAQKYGTIEHGAEPWVTGRIMPRQTTKSNRVSKTMRTLAEAPITSDEMYESLQKYVLKGTGTYTPVSNASTMSKAVSNIERLGGARNALASLNNDVATNNGKSTDLLAMAEALYMDSEAMASLSDIEREQLVNDMCLVASDAGRALQLMNEIKRSTPEGHIDYMEKSGKRMAQKYEKHTGKPTNLSLTAEEKQAYRDAKTPEERQEIDKYVAKRWSQETSDLPLLDKLRNWRYFSMLGNARTHFRNMVGNAMMYPVVRVKDAINTGYQRLFNVAQEDRTTTALPVRMDEQTRAYVKAAEREALPIMQGVSAKYIETLNKTKGKAANATENEGKLRSLIEEAFTDVPSARITNGRTRLGRALNKLSSANSNFLEMEDALALGLRFRSSFAQQIAAKGLDINKITADQRNQIMNYAMEESLRATFRDASKLADAINRLEQTNKGTQFFVSAIMPFKKTPINIAKRSLEYSPIGLIEAAYKGISNNHAYKTQIEAIDSMKGISESERASRKAAAENAYKAGRIAAIDRLSAGTTGTILMGLGLFAASMGWISVGKKDDESDTFESALGRNNYSLNIGDVSIDLSAFSPAAIPLIMGASLYEGIKDKRDGDESMVSSVMSVLTSTLDPITEMTVLSGIGDALKNVNSSYDDPGVLNWMSGIATNAATSYVGQFVPTFVGQVARVSDPYARSYSAGGDYWASAAGSEVGYAAKNLQNKIPGVSWLSEPKVDLHGNEVENYTNWGAGVAHVLNNFILPATIKFDQKNEVDDELVRLYGVTDSTDIFPQKPNRNLGSYTDKKTNSTTTIKLENDSEYTAYQKEYGQAVYEALYDLTNSIAYARMTDEQKANAIADVIDSAKKNVRSIWKAREIQKLGK